MLQSNRHRDKAFKSGDKSLSAEKYGVYPAKLPTECGREIKIFLDMQSPRFPSFLRKLLEDVLQLNKASARKGVGSRKPNPTQEGLSQS